MGLGYRRAVCGDGTLAMQRLVLEAARCDRVFEDLGMAGLDPSRAALGELLDALAPGDALVVWRLDRLAQDFTGVVEVMAQVLLQGGRVLAVAEDIDSDRLGRDQLAVVVRAFLSHHGNREADQALSAWRSRCA